MLKVKERNILAVSHETNYFVKFFLMGQRVRQDATVLLATFMVRTMIIFQSILKKEVRSKANFFYNRF